MRPRLLDLGFGKVSTGEYVGRRDGGRVLPGRIRPPLWSTANRRTAAGIDWAVSGRELRQMIPPAYTEWLGRQILDLEVSRTA